MKRTKKYFTKFFLFIILFGCSPEVINFNFNGRLVLFSSKEKDEINVYLLNIDTNEKLKLDGLHEMQSSELLLYNGGKNVFVNQKEYNYFLKYDVLTKNKIKIYLGVQSNLLPQFVDISIQHDTLYFASDSKITSCSIEDFDIIREYNTESLINEFAVLNENRIFVTHYSFDFEKKLHNWSNLILYNFTIPEYKIELSYKGILTKCSSDGRYLLFTKALIPYLLEDSSLAIKKLDGLGQDSVKIVGESYFIDNDLLIFPAFKISNPKKQTDLYIYDLAKDQITKKITNSGNIIEIKSSIY